MRHGWKWVHIAVYFYRRRASELDGVVGQMFDVKSLRWLLDMNLSRCLSLCCGQTLGPGLANNAEAHWIRRCRIGSGAFSDIFVVFMRTNSKKKYQSNSKMPVSESVHVVMHVWNQHYHKVWLTASVGWFTWIIVTGWTSDYIHNSSSLTCILWAVASCFGSCCHADRKLGFRHSGQYCLITMPCDSCGRRHNKDIWPPKYRFLSQGHVDVTVHVDTIS